MLETGLSIRSWLGWLLAAGMCLAVWVPVQAFTTVINVPPDTAPGEIGSDTQLNLYDGGVIPVGFRAGSPWADFPYTDLEVNIHGGQVAIGFSVYWGAVVNIYGGALYGEIEVLRGTMSMYDGIIQPARIDVQEDGELNLHGGEVRGMLDNSGGTVFMSGGSVNWLGAGVDFSSQIQSLLHVDGGEVDQLYIGNGAQASLKNASIGFANLSEGSDVSLQEVTFDGDLSIFQGANVSLSSGLIRGDLSVWGPNATLDMSGGTVQGRVDVAMGYISISGGSFDSTFEADNNSVVNLIGRDFLIDGTPVTGGMAYDIPTEVLDRDVVLSGILADGSAFSFDLNSARTPGADFFDPDTTITITLVTLPGDLNSDGFVGLDDLDIILPAWNTSVTPGDLLAGDPSGDGFVGLDDLDLVLNNWNTGTPPAAQNIPEPAAMWLWLFASAGSLRRRRVA